ncbi:MAG: heat shock protein HspQ [Brevundimonas sp.]|uniref:heat shock protein HspQ n=1 Tax=Brevundimonas sp. TaxID=1871086 RepID=UPI001A2AD13D|nr:heat shock protein HspQ [Brevundimonas sp.]MBJ7319141.1 heat shock protein HspQ [Brevundimonas sp.]
MTQVHTARFAIGQIVRHRDNAFRGVVMDVDHGYAGPAVETGAVAADQPFYRVFALGEDGGFVAYAAEGVLEDGQSVLLPDDAQRWFTTDAEGHHAPLHECIH